MRRRRSIYAVAAALAAVVAVTHLVRTGTGNSGASDSGDPDSVAANSGVEGGPLAADDLPPAGETPRSSRRDRGRAGEPADDPADRARVDIARVEAALARLQATTARFTQEDLAEEQKRMAEAKARFEAIEVKPPETREFTDKSGVRWIELRHASGEIRYELAPDEEAEEADSAP